MIFLASFNQDLCVIAQQLWRYKEGGAVSAGKRSPQQLFSPLVEVLAYVILNCWWNGGLGLSHSSHCFGISSAHTTICK